MVNVKVKVVHLIEQFGSRSKAVCNRWVPVVPIEALIIGCPSMYLSKGTFDPEKVTCKRCLKSGDYKIAMDRLKYPLFFLGK